MCVFSAGRELITEDTLDGLVEELVAKYDAGELVADRAIEEIVTSMGHA